MRTLFQTKRIKYVSVDYQLVSGAVGGNVAGSLMKKNSLGTLWNSVAGIAGGGLGGQLLGMISPAIGAAASSGNLDLGSIFGKYCRWWSWRRRGYGDCRID